MIFGNEQLDAKVKQYLEDLPENHDHADVEISVNQGEAVIAVSYEKDLGKNWKLKGEAFAEHAMFTGVNDYGVKVRLSKEI